MVRCFYDGSVGARGNAARVSVVHAAKDFVPVSGAPAAAAQVFASPAPNGWLVESYTDAGQPIRFCGHGALAAAFVLFDAHKDLAEIVCRNAHHAWTARRGSADYPVRLEYETPAIERIDVPPGIEAWLGGNVIAAGRSGGAKGYLILQLDNVAQLDAVRPDAVRLGALTACAVIATAKTDAPGDAAYRYFAPQYGVDEDAATGSAAVQLASWWAVHTGRRQFALHQRSLSGGWLLVRCNTDTVELSGRVAYG